MGGKKVFELILEIGHKSTPLSKKLANGYTHKWTAFVRGVENSKIEHCIQRVVFQLHESFDNPYRDISEPPFQVKETGYAGFEIPIQIYFKNREKPNHLVFVHDLSLLANKSNNASTIEKIKFINPNREFEKCLIKSGAQLLTAPVKKERSDSPPAKKQKSSSLIPSKDMSKQQLHQQIQQQQIQQQQQQLINHQQSQQQPQQQQQLQPHSQPQPQQNHNQNHQSKPHTSKSKEFIDIFGAPLAYNGKSNPLLDIKTKISSLSDCDRLQKIVDIIEEAGEWFNLTPKKFEFDLKRLDKKTLHRIERCLTR